MNHELKRMWMQAVMAHFKVLTQSFPGRTEENHEIPQFVQPVVEPRLSKNKKNIVYPGNHTKPINTLLGQNAELLNFKAEGTYSYHSALKADVKNK